MKSIFSFLIIFTFFSTVIFGQDSTSAFPHHLPVNSISVSPNGEYFVSCAGKAGSAGELLLWRANSGRQHAIVYPNINFEIRTACFTPNGMYIMTAGGSYTESSIQFWEILTGNVLHDFQNVPERIRNAAFSSDGQYLFSIHSVPNSRKSKITKWNMLKEIVNEIEFDTLQTNITAFRRDGLQIAMIGYEGSVVLLSAESGVKELSFMRNNSSKITTLDYNLTGTKLIIGTATGRVEVWNIEDNLRLETTVAENTGKVTCAKISPNQKMILVSTVTENNSQFQVYDLNSRELLKIFKIEGEITTFDITPDSRYVMLGTKEGNIQFFDLEKKSEQ